MSIFATSKALTAIAFRLGELDIEVRSMKTASRALELEFSELYDKVRHQMSRMSKRDAIARKNGEDIPEVDEPPGLYDHLDPISKKIMMRRGIRRQAE